MALCYLGNASLPMSYLTSKGGFRAGCDVPIIEFTARELQGPMSITCEVCYPKFSHILMGKEFLDNNEVSTSKEFCWIMNTSALAIELHMIYICIIHTYI